MWIYIFIYKHHFICYFLFIKLSYSTVFILNKSLNGLDTTVGAIFIVSFFVYFDFYTTFCAVIFEIFLFKVILLPKENVL